MENRFAVCAALAASLALADAIAQPGQVVEDSDVGFRLTIPKDWEWKARGRDVFVNCAPKIESRPGVPGCFFAVQKHKISPDQATITDADREKWKKWTHADGMRPLVSTRDLELGGYPAHEIVVKQGKERNAATSSRVFILFPRDKVIDAFHFAHWEEADQSAATLPAFWGALQTVKPFK